MVVLRMVALSQINQMKQQDFVEAFGEVFEHTPSIAAKAWEFRPFASLHHLHLSMVKAMESLRPEEKVALIQAHPDLGIKTQMAESSVKEQAGAGLDQLTPAEYEQFYSLNQAYKAKHGFPFIIAVRNHTRSSILQSFRQRTQQPNDVELNHALAEIAAIAFYRLRDRVVPEPVGAEEP